MSTFISLIDGRIVTIRRDDGAVMYRGPVAGQYKPTYPPASPAADRHFASLGHVCHPDWVAMAFEERARIVRETNADPTMRPARHPRVARPGYEQVAEFVGARLVIRERKVRS